MSTLSHEKRGLELMAVTHNNKWKVLLSGISGRLALLIGGGLAILAGGRAGVANAAPTAPEIGPQESHVTLVSAPKQLPPKLILKQMGDGYKLVAQHASHSSHSSHSSHASHASHASHSSHVSGGF